MKITVLSDNQPSKNHPTLLSEWGLSLYVETGRHKLLFDCGGSNIFAENARKLGIDIEKVDAIILSHAHHDHGNGLKALMPQSHDISLWKEPLTKVEFLLKIKACEKFYRRHITNIPRIKF